MIPGLNFSLSWWVWVWLERNDLNWDVKSSLQPVSIIYQIVWTQHNHHNKGGLADGDGKGVKSLVWSYHELIGWQLGVLLLTWKQTTNEHVHVDNKINTEGGTEREENCRWLFSWFLIFFSYNDLCIRQTMCLSKIEYVFQESIQS